MKRLNYGVRRDGGRWILEEDDGSATKPEEAVFGMSVVAFYGNKFFFFFEEFDSFDVVGRI